VGVRGEDGAEVLGFLGEGQGTAVDGIMVLTLVGDSQDLTLVGIELHEPFLSQSCCLSMSSGRIVSILRKNGFFANTTY